MADALNRVEIEIATEQYPVTEIGGYSVISTGDYDQLTNKPQVNGVTLTGNKTGTVLGLMNASDAHLTDASVASGTLTLTKQDGTTVTYAGGGGGTPEWSAVQNKPFTSIGSGLKVESGVLKVDTIATMVQDNTQPITSGGVYTVVGNINALLETI